MSEELKPGYMSWSPDYKSDLSQLNITSESVYEIEPAGEIQNELTQARKTIEQLKTEVSELNKKLDNFNIPKVIHVLEGTSTLLLDAFGEADKSKNFKKSEWYNNGRNEVLKMMNHLAEILYEY